MKRKMHTFPRGIFTISIDYEFGLGRTPQIFFLPEEEKLVQEEVVIVRRLLSLFEEFRIPVT